MGATAQGIRAGRAFVELFADDSKLQAVLKRTQVRMLSLSDFIRTVGLRMASGSALLSVPIIKATSDYVKFSDQMLEVAGITSATNKQLDMLTKTARRLAMRRGTSFLAQDIGALMSELGRAGFATDEINKMTRSVLLLARASKTDVALSAKITGSTMRQFQKDISEAGNVTDLLAKTANASATSLESLGASLEYAGPPAYQLGYSLQRTLAIIGTLGNIGIVGTEAGTAIRRLAAMTASDADRMQQVFGVSFKDSAGNALPLVDVLERVNQATKNLGSADRLKKYHDAFGILGITSSIAVGQTAGSIRELERELQNVTGYAERAAKAMDSGIGGSLRVSWAALKDFGLSIGTVLDKHLVPQIDKAGIAFKTLSDFTMKNPQVIVDIAKGVAGIGAAGVSLMAIGTAGGLAALNLRGIGYALRFALTPARALSAALSGVLGVIAKTNRMGTSLAGVLMSSVSLPGLSSLSSGRDKGRGKSYAKAQSRKDYQRMVAGVSAGGSQMMAGFGSLRNVFRRPEVPAAETPETPKAVGELPKVRDKSLGLSAKSSAVSVFVTNWPSRMIESIATKTPKQRSKSDSGIGKKLGEMMGAKPVVSELPVKESVEKSVKPAKASDSGIGKKLGEMMGVKPVFHQVDHYTGAPILKPTLPKFAGPTPDRSVVDSLAAAMSSSLPSMTELMGGKRIDRVKPTGPELDYGKIMAMKMGQPKPTMALPKFAGPTPDRRPVHSVAAAMSSSLPSMTEMMAKAAYPKLPMKAGFFERWFPKQKPVASSLDLFKGFTEKKAAPPKIGWIRSIGTMSVNAAKSLARMIPGFYGVSAGALKASSSVGRLVALKGFAELVSGASMLLSPMGLVAAGALVVAANWGRISGAVRSVVASAPGELSGMWARIRGDALPTLSGIKETALRSFGAISEAVQAGDIPAAMSILWSGIRTIWAEGFGYLRMKWFDVTTWASDAFTGVLQVATTSAASITNTLDLALFDWFGVRLNDVTAAFGTAWAWIGEKSSAVGTWVAEKWDSVFGGMGEAGQSMADIVWNSFEWIRKKIASTILTMMSAAKMVADLDPTGMTSKALGLNHFNVDEARKSLDEQFVGRKQEREKVKNADPVMDARVEAARKRVEDLEAERLKNAGAAGEERQKLAKDLEAKLKLEKENLATVIKETAEKRRQREEADAAAGKAPKEAATGPTVTPTGPRSMPNGLSKREQARWTAQERIRQREEMVAQRRAAIEGRKKPKKAVRGDWAKELAEVDWSEEMEVQKKADDRKKLIEAEKAKIAAEKKRRDREKAGIGPQFEDDATAAERERLLEAAQKRKEAEKQRVPDLASAKADLKSRIPDLQAMRMASLGGAGKASPTPGSQIKIDQGAVIAKLEETHRDDARYYVGIIDALRELIRNGQVTA